MSPIQKCIRTKSTEINPIWLMRQAGRYLPEFRDIRLKNPDFIKLCLNENLSSEITLQPLKRFDFDAAIIFSDILMLPYGLGQEVNFKKNFGPQLGDINIENILKQNNENFVERLSPVYKSLKITSQNKLLKNKDLIGFVGAPWTLLVYMINKISPKNNLNENFFKDTYLIKQLLKIINKFLKIHIEQQIKNGATIIQIFDSWAGLLEKKDVEEYIYIPTLELVNHIKLLNTPVICFPRGIKNYNEFVSTIKPDVINIDYDIDPKKISKEIDITIQGGLDPKILLTDKENLKKKTHNYLEIFRDKPYIFNLGHGVLPETDPMMVDYLVKYVKNFK
tara:strand:+ start:524 stop:1528 length:1005 start_codon:yes stop_codon:yes gene_type:complete